MLMQFRYISTFALIAALSACSGGGGGGGGGTGSLPVSNPDGAVLSASGGNLGITTNTGLNLTFPVDADFDADDFAGASNLDGDGEGQILAIAQGSSTFAALVLTRDAGATADAFFGRTTASDSIPGGTATLTGTYVGAFVDPDQDPTQSYIDGNISLSVDLDERTIGGTVTNLTTEVFGSTETASLDDIILPNMSITNTGTFSGTGNRTITDSEGGPDTTIATTVGGLIGGSSLANLEAVGTINTTSTAGSATQAQSGVFFADNN